MSTHARVLSLIRQLHLYLGIFIAPAILFFAITGALQTVSLHETTKGSTYKPAKWIVMMAQIHKKQTMQVPPQKLQRAATQPSPADSPQKGAAPEDKVVPRNMHSMPLKVFFLLVSAGLITSTFSGLYMSYRYCRNKVAMAVLLIAGIVVPIALTLG